MGVKAGCADALALLGTIELSMARLTPNCRAKPRATASGAWTMGEYQAKSRAGLSVGGGTAAQRAFAYPEPFSAEWRTPPGCSDPAIATCRPTRDVERQFIPHGLGDFARTAELRARERLADSQIIATPTTCPIRSISVGYRKTAGFRWDAGCGSTTSRSPVRSHQPQT